jgi:tetratricopeptide (TPR) repeat protein
VRASAVSALEPALSQAVVPGVAGAVQARLKDSARNVRIAAAWSLRATLDENSPAGIELQHYLDINADEPVGQLNKGNYFYARNDLQSAVPHLQKAVDWDAYSAPFHQSLAVILGALNRPGEAVQTLQQAVRLSPDDADSHYLLGLAYNQTGDLTNATAQLTAAVRLEPRHVLAWYNLGLAQNALGQPDSAIASLLRAESLAPTDGQIPYARAIILTRTGRNSEAVLAVKRSLEIDPSNAEALQLYAKLRLSQP